jgi:hypothetical protein
VPLLPERTAFAAAHGLAVKAGATAHQFVLEGEAAGRKVTMTQGSIIQPRSGGKLFHYRLTLEPYVREVHWMLTPQGATRWAGNAPSQVQPSDVPGWARFGEPLQAFGDEVKTHWQLKLGEQGRLYLEALELVSPRAWELAWTTVSAAWEAS